MSRHLTRGVVVNVVNQRTFAVRVDDLDRASRFRGWWRQTDRQTMISTTTSTMGPDDGGIPLIYFGVQELIGKCQVGDLVELTIEAEDRVNKRGIRAVGLEVIQAGYEIVV